MKPSAGPILGKVELEEVVHTVAEGNKDRPMTIVKKPTTPELPSIVVTPVVAGIDLHVTIDELHDANIIKTLLQKIYDGIDNAPPAATLREQKRAIKLQERIETLINGMEGKE